MAVVYATYSEFVGRYPNTQLTQSQVESVWLVHGSNRVHEMLGGVFSIPFSSNNETARDLNLGFAYLGILERTKPGEDSRELGRAMIERVDAIRLGNLPMVTSSGEAIFSTLARNDVWSNTMDYEPVFGPHDTEDQRIDPDWIQDTLDELD